MAGDTVAGSTSAAAASPLGSVVLGPVRDRAGAEISRAAPPSAATADVPPSPHAPSGAVEAQAGGPAQAVGGAGARLAPTAETVKASPGGALDGGTEPAIVGALSPSRASDFMTCPLLYRFRVVDRLPERPGLAATRGTIVHAVLEELFDLPPLDRTPERAGVLVRPAWERLLAAEPDLASLFAGDSDGSALAGWLSSAAELVGRYFTLEDPRRLQPVERELYVETMLGTGLVLRGYVDRLDVAPGGAMRVVDYKTGRAPGAGFEAKALFQMRFYALVLWRLRGEVPRLLQLIYLGSGEVLRYEPDESDLRATERKVRALWDAITKAAETGDWRASPSKLCEWCDHRERCPAFGGTPPPLPAALDQPAMFDAPGDLPGTDAPTPRQTHFDDI